MSMHTICNVAGAGSRKKLAFTPTREAASVMLASYEESSVSDPLPDPNSEKMRIQLHIQNYRKKSLQAAVIIIFFSRI